MRRDLRALADEWFDVLVVGGGVVGASIARDAALRGLRTALVERGDFGCGTSWNSLKIIHGGLRDLQRLDFARARTYARERSAWLRIAPHLVEPLPILVPARRKGLERRSMLRAALLLNDVVTWDRNRGLLEGRRLPAGRTVSNHEFASLAPEFDPVAGGVVFHDAQLYSSERAVLALVRGAVAAGAVAANYVSFQAPVLSAGRLVAARLEDRLGGCELDVRARVLVNACGPLAGTVAGSLIGADPAVPAYSLAINVMIGGPAPAVAVALAGNAAGPTGASGGRGRRLLVVPWRGRTLVGTGHYAIASGMTSERRPYRTRHDLSAPAPDAWPAREEHVAAFLDEVNASRPGPSISLEDVLLVHAGLLPAASGGAPGSVSLLKRRRIVDHAAQGVPEAVTVVSVRLTTARLVAEEVTDLVCRKLRRKVEPCSTHAVPLPGAPTRPLDSVLTEAADHPVADSVDREALEHLVRCHGTEYARILSLRTADRRWNERLHPDAPVIRAQLMHAAREEMASTAEDLVWRRCELGARALASGRVVREAARILEECGQAAWTPAGLCSA